MAEEVKDPAAAPVAVVSTEAAAAPALTSQPAAGAPPEAAGVAVTAVPAVAAEAPKELPTAQLTLLEAFDAPKAEPAVEVKAEPAKVDPEKPVEVEAKVEPEVKVEPEKPAEVKAEPEKPAVEAKPVEPVKPEPVEYKYETPENVVIDEKIKEAFHGALDAFRADPTNPKPLLDLYAAKTAEFAAAQFEQQHKVFADTRAGWRTEVMADPEFGGAGYQTSMTAVARMRDRFASSAKPGTPKYAADMKAFNDMLHVTGGGDHPALIRYMHNVAQAFDEAALPPPNPKPVVDGGRAPGSKGAGMYSNERSPTLKS